MGDHNDKIISELVELEKQYGDYEKMPSEVQKKYRELEFELEFTE